MRWENKVYFDCPLSQQHLCQKLSQSKRVCKDYSKSKMGRFFGTQCTYLLVLIPVNMSVTLAVCDFVQWCEFRSIDRLGVYCHISHFEVIVVVHAGTIKLVSGNFI